MQWGDNVGNILIENYRQCFGESPYAFSLIEIVRDECGKACDFIYRYVNKPLLKMIGCSIDITNLGYLEIFRNHNGKWIEIYGTLADIGKPDSFIKYSEDVGKYFNVQCYFPQKDYCACLLTDVTEQYRVLNELQEAKSQLKIAVEYASMIYWLYDIELDEIEFGELAKKILKLKTAKFKGMPQAWFDIGYMPKKYFDEYAQMLDRLKNGEDTVSMEIELNHPSDNRVTYHKIVYNAIAKSGDKTIRAIGTSADITEQKIAQQKYAHELKVRNELLRDSVINYQYNLTTGIVEQKENRFYKKNSVKSAF